MHRDMSGLSEHEQHTVAENRMEPVVLSYSYNGSQFKIRAAGGDVNARTHALDNAYSSLQGFSTKFEQYMCPRSGIDAKEDDQLLCAMRQSGGATPEITIAFRIDPSLGRVERNSIVAEMNRYVSEATGVPLNTGIRQV